MAASKQQQVLILDPSNELTFKGPFNDYVTSNLHLTNPTNRLVFFKVKVTAPRFYCVRPNSGLIKPKDTALISIMLQPVDQVSTLENERSRHKFMIQTSYAPDDWSEASQVTPEQFWKNVDQSTVMDSKLRVVFQKQSGEIIESAASQRTYSESSGQQHSSVTTHESGHKKEELDRSSLQKEIELRKMYQDEKKNLERENYILMDKLDKISRSGTSTIGEGFPTLHVILIALFALLVGIIIGKLF